ncbi:MAG: CapA family protein [Bacteroidales bacterium]
MLKLKNCVLILMVLIFFHGIIPGEKINSNDMYLKKKVLSDEIVLFTCGDVMTGRGIDQVLPHSVDPDLYETYVKDARRYVKIAEEEGGVIPFPVSYAYIWGDALEVWKQMNPLFKIINLETSITTHDEPWPGKGINYRMHPENTDVLKVAGIDYCSLANNHTLDWKQVGLLETMDALSKVGIKYSGAGRDLNSARAPSILEKQGKRVFVYAYGSVSSGIPMNWKASENMPGINVITELDDANIEKIASRIKSEKQPGDIVVFSIHWGSNWGYNVPALQKEFAHQLIDKAGVDIIHGHSSHHPRPIEVYNNKLILYGAGDFINDYEGITGHEQYRDDLTLMYFPVINTQDGTIVSMKMIPMKIENFQLNHVSSGDARWLQSVLDREGDEFGTGIVLNQDNSLTLTW